MKDRNSAGLPTEMQGKGGRSDRHGYRARVYEDYLVSHRKLGASRRGYLKPRAAQLRKLIRTHFPKDRNIRIVDLGCGHGALLYFLHEAGYRNAFGVDCSPAQVSAAARIGVEGVRVGDLLETLDELADGSQNIIVSFDVIEHFEQDELLALVDKVLRKLKVGGRWIIHTVNAESPFFGRIRYGDLTHKLAFTQGSILQLLLTSGFGKVQCYEDRPVVHGLKSAVRLGLWKCMRMAMRLWLAVEVGESDAGVVLSQNILVVAER